MDKSYVLTTRRFRESAIACFSDPDMSLAERAPQATLAINKAADATTNVKRVPGSEKLVVFKCVMVETE